MGLTAGEFFINLGIKGADKTIGALSNVKKGFGEITSMSLEAKAGILAAAYAFERLMAASGEFGTHISNLSALTGESTKKLQQYIYAGKQVGVSAGEMEASFKGVQNVLTNIRLNKGAPEGMAQLIKAVHLDPAKMRKDTAESVEYVLEKIRQASGKLQNTPGLRNAIIKSFGVGEGFIAGSARGGFTKEALSKAPTYGDKEIGQLDKANIAWSNLGNKIEMAFGHFNAAHGMQLVNDFTKITDATIKFAEALTVLGEKLKVFQAIAFVINELAGSMKDISGFMGGSRSFWGEDLDKSGKVIGDKSITHKIADLFKPGTYQTGQSAESKLYDQIHNIKPIWYQGTTSKAVTPNVPKVSAPGSTQNINVNQNLNFQHDGKDHKKTGDSTKKAVKDALFNSPAKLRGA